MSWYRDPQLFIYGGYNGRFYVNRVRKEFGVIPITNTDLEEQGTKLEFSKHLSLGNNKESDFDAFKASFPKSGTYIKIINSQGFVINWDTNNKGTSWSIEDPNSAFWSLPGIKSLTGEQALEKKVLEAKISSLQDEVNNNKFEKEALHKRVLDLEAENSRLKAQVNRERDVKPLASLEKKQVSDSTSKHIHGESSVEEPWINGQKVPENWVRFEELDALVLSQNIPLTITKATGGSKLGFDRTTNIQANRFYRGIFPIVLVDVAELAPNRDEARLDPYVWGSYNNAGISYAARKLFASEMSVDAHKTG